jgi:LPXTG-motif cell wall-anchored protein
VNRRAFPLGRVPRVGEPGALAAPAAPGPAAGNPQPDRRNAKDPSRRQGTVNEGSEKASGEPDAPARQREHAPAALTAAEATESAPDDENNDTRTYGLGALGALALALGGGFLWYRRRLP